jgi:hypothetical protein
MFFAMLTVESLLPFINLEPGSISNIDSQHNYSFVFNPSAGTPYDRNERKNLLIVLQMDKN